MGYRQGTRARRWLLAACMVAIGATACDEDVVGRVAAFEPTREQLAGAWTGFAQVSDSPDALTMLDQGRSTTFTFPVALQLALDGGFVLRTVNLPTGTGGGTGDQLCHGFYAVRGRHLEFFADAACRALPLHRYTVGQALARVLILEADAGPARLGPGHASANPIRVVIRLERV